MGTAALQLLPHYNEVQSLARVPNPHMARRIRNEDERELGCEEAKRGAIKHGRRILPQQGQVANSRIAWDPLLEGLL